MPALPALALIATAGLRAVTALPWCPRSVRRVVLGALLAGVGALPAWLLMDSEDFYRFACRYHAERHEQAGRWLAENTLPGAVVGTPDVGAIAYYSKRRIVDAAGLVSREVTPWIGRPWYTDSLTVLFDRSGVTHLAVFEEWLPVVGVAPLVVFNREPEVMRIYAWVHGHTRLRPAASAP